MLKDTVARLETIYEIGQYVARSKPSNEKLLKYLKFLKDGYEEKLVKETELSHRLRKTRRGVKNK